MSSGKKKARTYTAAEKLRILDEARQPNTTGGGGSETPPGGRDDVLPVGAPGEGGDARSAVGSSVEDREALALVAWTKRRTGWTLRRILRRLGFPKSRYYAWRQMVEEDVAYVSPVPDPGRCEFDLEHIRIRTYHPESNGKVERFHRSTREALDEIELANLGQAREVIGRWVAYYNDQRLHASLDYLPPAEYWAGHPDARKQERKEKLERGRERRANINRQRLHKAA